jgi:hypothetical protein
VTISGTGFLSGATVKLGGAGATGVVVVDSRTITATTVPHATGAVDVVVTNPDSQSGTLSGGYTYSSASGGAISFVQQNFALSTSSSSLTVNYPSAQTAGNLNIVAVGWNDTSAAVSSVVDSLGNPYTLALGPTTGTALSQSIYYAKNIAGGSNAVTVRFDQTAVYPDVRVLEYSGADTANPLDVRAAAVGTGLTASSGLAATTSLNELIFGAGMTFDVFSAAGSGFTQRVITNFGDIAEDATVLSMGSYGATATLRYSAPWVMQMATFRGQSSSNPAFMATGISPSSGSVGGGTVVTITGTGFSAGAGVTFGGISATSATVTSSSSIVATTPPHTAGTVDVVLTNGAGQNATLANGYTYTAQGSSKHSVAMTWNASPSTDAAYYRVYRGSVSGGPYSLLGTNITNTAYTDSTVQAGATYYYVATTVDTSGLESASSNQLKCVIPVP